MLHSMTGYGEATIENDRIRVGFRIRTVNNKGLDLSIKLPFDFMYLENDLRSAAREFCFRGRVDVYCEIEIRDPEIKPPTPLNQPRLVQLMEMCKEIKSLYEVEGKPDINTLLGMNDLTITQRVGFRLPEEVAAQIFIAFREALGKLALSRQTEAAKLHKDFKKRLHKTREVVHELEQVSENRQAELREQIVKRVESLMEEAQVDEVRLSQEVVYYADRLDISEEITRIKAHLDTTENLLDSGKRPLGKELDFMIQEQMREVTTIGNKAKNRWIADKVVALKTGYEKIREQIQNIE